MDNATADIPPTLEALIARVERHQENLRLNDARFVARYQRHLKSVDSWARTLKTRNPERLSERNYGRWERALQDLVAEVEDSSGGEQIHPLPILAEAIHLYERLQGARGDIRVGWLIGTTGIGKSVALRHLAKLNGKRAAYLIIPELWRDSRIALTHGIARAIGVEPQARVSDTFEAVVARLNVEPVTFLVDEFHEGGVLLVKIIKSLIERTLSRFLLTTWPQGYARLTNGPEGMGETRQLVGRSLRPICTHWRHGCRVSDIDAYFVHACGGLTAEERGDIAREFLPHTRRWGLRLVLQSVEAAQSVAEASRDSHECNAAELREAFLALSDDVLSAALPAVGGR